MKIENTRLALVGGAGLIGSHLTELLLSQPIRELVVYDNFVRGSRENLAGVVGDPRLTIIDGDIQDTGRLRAALEGIDGIFLLSALWLLECAEDAAAALRVNVHGNWNVVEQARLAGVKRLVFSSSASVYGDAVREPMDEQHPLNNRTTYGATKIAVEQLLRAYAAQHGFPYVTLRYFNVYGPRQDYKNAYVSVIMKVLDRIDAAEPPIIYGTGEQAYDFIYVKDIARANLLAMQSDITDEVFNVCTGVKTSINELVQLLLAITGSALRPQYVPAEQTFVTNRVGDPQRARASLGFSPTVPLEQGLRELVEWRATVISSARE